MRKITANPFLFFLPFLLMYVFIVLLGHKDVMEGDEGRYYMYAQNLLHGFYSPAGEVYLWNGPGYPLILVPFIAMGLPLIFSTLLNALFQYISVVFIYKTLRLFVSSKTALFFSIFWACYYIAFKEMLLLYTESLANMLVCIFLYYAATAFLAEKKQKKAVVISGILLGYLILTKVIFGYIILALLLLAVCVYLIWHSLAAKKSLLIVLIALLVNLPYLIYTFNLTGKAFYWANSGGMSLYWASTPVPQEFGDWNDDNFTAYCGYDENMPCNAQLFAKHHQADYDSIYKYTGVARDEAFRKKGVKNIKQYPLKYVKNCIANAGRFFFGLPYSYNYHRFQNLARIPPGALVFTMLLFSMITSLIHWRRLPFVIYFFVTILILYLGSSLIVSTNQRQLVLAVPCIIVWTAFLFERTFVPRAGGERKYT